VHYDPMEPLLKAATHKTWRQFAMCEWAATMMRREGMDPRVVPLGVDVETFRPITGLMDQKGQVMVQSELKKSVGAMKDEFLVGMVAANIDFRKGLELQLRVFADFNRKYKDSHLFIKTNPSRDAGGIDIPKAVSVLCGLSPDKPRAPVSFPGHDHMEVSMHQMCMYYNAMDVYLGCAFSEGFGLPVVEAGACGVPQIVTDFAAMSEVGYGWKVKGTKELNVLNSFGMRPDEQGIWNALEAAYNMRGTPEWQALKQGARDHAVTNYAYDHVVNDIMQKELEEWQLDRPL
jgi:glycosyltransferase involved in cell wall biosynthesis